MSDFIIHIHPIWADMSDFLSFFQKNHPHIQQLSKAAKGAKPCINTPRSILGFEISKTIDAENILAQQKSNKVLPAIK